MNIFPLKTHAAAARHIYPFTLFKPYDKMKLKYQEIVDNLVNMIMHKNELPRSRDCGVSIPLILATRSVFYKEAQQSCGELNPKRLKRA